MATDQTTIEALRHYVRHLADCPAERLAGRYTRTNHGEFPSVFNNPGVCHCGLDDVLRGIEAEKAGRNIGRNTNGN